MRHHTEITSEIIFTRFPSNNTEKHARSSARHKTNVLLSTIKKKILTYRNQLQNAIAVLGIGSIFLLGVFLFLTQLAEYGWN